MRKSRLPPDIDNRRRAFLKGMGGLAAGAAWAEPALAATADPARGLPSSGGELGDLGVSRHSPDYEVWRQSMIWQRRKSSRYPDVIVQADTVDDVIAAVNHARKRRLRIATRCGGHSVSACFLRDGGMLIDVSRLNQVSIDAQGGIFHAGPGVIARGLSEKLRQAGLAFPTAHCGMVPLGGFLLGGGLGLNGNQWGEMSTFNIAAVDIVTADGVLRTASPTVNPDLFWAVRGGGPGLFGVVTRFHLKAYDLPRAIIGNTLTFTFADIVEVTAALADIAPKIDRNVEILGYIGAAPASWDAGCTAPGCGLAVYVDANAYVDSEGEAVRKLRPLMAHAILTRAKVRETGRRSTIEELYFAEELGFSQRRWAADNVFTNRIGEVAQVLRHRMPSCPAKDAQAVFLYKGNPKMPDAACSTMGEFYAAYYMLWDDQSEDRVMTEYLADLYREITPLGVGSNINEMNQEGRPADLRMCYSAAAWQRLGELRARWDSGGVFHDFYGLS